MTDRPTILLCTSNGVGLGHLSRVMAVAQHLTERFDVVIFTLSAAVSIPVSQGFRTEYLRSHEYSEFDGRTWNSLLDQRLEHLHDLYEPTALMFDGTHPYAGLCRYLDRHPELLKIWERRGMWRPGQGEEAMLRARHFDAVVEPGDYAHEYDQGATAQVTQGVERVAPIRYGPPPIGRAEARAALGLEGDDPTALVQLGAGRINDVGSLIRRVVDGLLGAQARVVIAASVLADPPDPDDGGISVVQEYPISRYFNAFDMGFFAGGYNSFHEALSLQLPSVLVPNMHTKLDDQAARTRWADDHGMAVDWSDGDRASLAGAIERLVDPTERERLRSAMRSLADASGGGEVAALLASHVSPT